MTLETDALDLALDILALNARFIRESRTLIGPEDVHSKGVEGPVTIADLAGQALLRLRLEGDVRVPVLPLCGEEGSEVLRATGSDRLRARVLELVRSEVPSVGASELLELLDRGAHRPADGGSETYWICDPIDGTRRYLSGHRYSSCLALVVDGRLRCGAIACPDLAGDPEDSLESSDATGSLFGVISGGGAYRIEDPESGARGPRTRLRLAPRPEGDRTLRVARTVTADVLRPESFWSAVGRDGFMIEVVPIDNQCKYVALATGRVDCLYQHAGAPDWTPGHVWDFAPGVLLASEAGAVVTDRLGTPFDFDRGSTLAGNRGLLALRPGIEGFPPSST